MSGGRVGMERRVDFPPCRYRTGSVAMDVAFFFVFASTVACDFKLIWI